MTFNTMKLALAAATLLVCGGVASAVAADDRVVSLRDDAAEYLYHGPSERSGSRRTLEPGESVQVFQCKNIEALQWCRVNLSGDFGWVKAKAIANETKSSDRGDPSRSAHEIYRGPSTYSPMIGRLDADAEPKVLLCKTIEGAKWCKVNADGTYGWVQR